MSAEIQELIAAARSVQGSFPLAADFHAGEVGAALRAESGAIYTGICIDVTCGIGFCAEHAAVAEMLKRRECVVQMMVAVSGDSIVPPCGRCRELLMQLSERNADTRVVLGEREIVALRDLLPRHWL